MKALSEEEKKDMAQTDVKLYVRSEYDRQKYLFSY
jgi:redox-regulated HSP33 family molecular chaperone